MGAEEIEMVFQDILDEIIDGKALRNILRMNNMPSVSRFYSWLENIDGYQERYARACDLRAEVIFEEILQIADDKSEDLLGISPNGKPLLNKEFAARSRVRIDARKWMLMKLQPKKYGDITDITTDGKPLESPKHLVIKIKRNEDN